MIRHFALISSLFLIAGCGSRPVIPDTKEVKVSRDEAASGCREIGKVTGTTLTAKGTAEEAVDDLKREAANKGANYVTIKTFSDNRTSVTGLAYECL